MSLTIPANKREQIFSKLKAANTAFQEIYPGDKPDRQAVHTLYGGANLFNAEATAKMGARALEIFNTYAPDFVSFGKIFHLDGSDQFDATQGFVAIKEAYDTLPLAEKKKHPARLSYEVYHKVIAKLQTEAIEDFRIDFEDGYGNRSNEEEDATAIETATEVAKGMVQKSLPPFIGIRIKPFTEEMKERGLRTLDLFVSTLVKASGGKMPDNFIVMLPTAMVSSSA